MSYAYVNNVLDRFKLRINSDNNHTPDNIKMMFMKKALKD